MVLLGSQKVFKMRKALISTLALLALGCGTTNKVIKSVEQPVKTPEQVTKEYHEDMATLRKDALKEGAVYEAEFVKELERVKQGKRESYEKVMELYGKLEEKRKKAYDTEMERIIQTRRALHSRKVFFVFIFSKTGL